MAKDIAVREGVDGVVMGHTHKPVDAAIRGAGARYVNIGSWTRYLRVAEGERLHSWNMLRSGEHRRFPFRVVYAWYDGAAAERLRAVPFREGRDG
jgi:hypothetical protein